VLILVARIHTDLLFPVFFVFVNDWRRICLENLKQKRYVKAKRMVRTKKAKRKRNTSDLTDLAPRARKALVKAKAKVAPDEVEVQGGVQDDPDRPGVEDVDHEVNPLRIQNLKLRLKNEN
jgi:hypothetical protein